MKVPEQPAKLRKKVDETRTHKDSKGRVLALEERCEELTDVVQTMRTRERELEEQVAYPTLILILVIMLYDHIPLLYVQVLAMCLKNEALALQLKHSLMRELTLK